MCSLSHLELATNVVESSFGPTVAKVASRLLSHGNQTMAELGAALPNLPLPQMRNILLVLIQQNIVSSGVRARGRGGASVTEYDAELDEMLRRSTRDRARVFRTPESPWKSLTFGQTPLTFLIWKTSRNSVFF